MHLKLCLCKCTWGIFVGALSTLEFLICALALEIYQWCTRDLDKSCHEMQTGRWQNIFVRDRGFGPFIKGGGGGGNITSVRKTTFPDKSLKIKFLNQQQRRLDPFHPWNFSIHFQLALYCAILIPLLCLFVCTFA